MLNSIGYKSGLIANTGNALYYAILNGNEQQVKAILDSWLRPYWADVKPVQGLGLNPLVVAISMPVMLSAILAAYGNDCDWEIIGSALRVARYNNQLESIRIILEHYRAVIGECEKHDALRNAAKNGCHEFIDILLELYHEEISMQDKNYAFIKACKNDHHKSVRVLLEHCGEDITSWNKLQALEYALSEGHHKLLRAMLELCNVYFPTERKGFALKLAADMRQHKVVCVLLEHWKAAINAVDKGMALEFSAYSREFETVNALLEHCNAEISVTDKIKALQVAVQRRAHLSFNALLVHCNADIPRAVKSESFHKAIEKNQHEIVRALLEHCSTDISTEDKVWALEFAARRGHYKCIIVLLELCYADLNAANKIWALRLAVQNNHQECINSLLEYCSANMSVGEKGKALIDAATCGADRSLYILLVRFDKDITANNKIAAFQSLLHNNDDRPIRIFLKYATLNFDSDKMKTLRLSMLNIDYDRAKILQFCALTNRYRIIPALLEFWSDSLSELDKRLALFDAAAAGKLEAANALLDDPTIEAVACSKDQWIINLALEHAEIQDDPRAERFRRIHVVESIQGSSYTPSFAATSSSSHNCVDDVSRRAVKRENPEAPETRAAQAGLRRSKRLRDRYK